MLTLREKRPNTVFFWSLCSLNTGKYEEKLLIRTLFTQCELQLAMILLLACTTFFKIHKCQYFMCKHGLHYEIKNTIKFLLLRESGNTFWASPFRSKESYETASLSRKASMLVFQKCYLSIFRENEAKDFPKILYDLKWS